MTTTDRAICANYPLTVNRDTPLAHMIAAGRYDWTNNDITADHFPIAGSGTVEIVLTLFHFNRNMSTKTALWELDRRGFRPATIDELLALGANERTRDLQRQFPIAALGSVWRNSNGSGQRCPYLLGDRSNRYFFLCWVGLDWFARYRFAAVRK